MSRSTEIIKEWGMVEKKQMIVYWALLALSYLTIFFFSFDKPTYSSVFTFIYMQVSYAFTRSHYLGQISISFSALWHDKDLFTVITKNIAIIKNVVIIRNVIFQLAFSFWHLFKPIFRGTLMQIWKYPHIFKFT